MAIFPIMVSDSDLVNGGKADSSLPCALAACLALLAEYWLNALAECSESSYKVLLMVSARMISLHALEACPELPLNPGKSRREESTLAAFRHVIAPSVPINA